MFLSFAYFYFVTYLFQVNKIEIHYAKTAKKMDMKKLKQSMWHLLADSSKQADAEVTGRAFSPGAWHVGRGRLMSKAAG